MQSFPYRRINVVGAPGSGTSTLGRALAAKLAGAFVDADDFYWKPTVPPFTAKNEPNVRLAAIMETLAQSATTVVAGSVCGWGQALEDSFDLVVFLSIPTNIRMQRIEAREVAMFGAANPAFLAWAAQYEEGTMPGRSRSRHETWLKQRRCRVVRFDGDRPVHERVNEVMAIR